MNGLEFLVKDKRIKLYAFVIMPGHIHLTCLPAGRVGKCNINSSLSLGLCPPKRAGPGVAPRTGTFKLRLVREDTHGNS